MVLAVCECADGWLGHLLIFASSRESRVIEFKRLCNTVRRCCLRSSVGFVRLIEGEAR